MIIKIINNDIISSRFAWIRRESHSLSSGSIGEDKTLEPGARSRDTASQQCLSSRDSVSYFYQLFQGAAGNMDDSTSAHVRVTVYVGRSFRILEY